MATAARGSDGTFSIGRVLGRSVEVIAANPLLFVGLSVLISGVPRAIASLVIGRPVAMAGGAAALDAMSKAWPVTLIGFVLSALLTCALTRAAVEYLSGTRPGIRECVVTAAGLVLPTIAISLLVGFGSVLGMLLLVVPGIILWLGWSVAIPVLVQERRGVFESMRRSRALTRGNRWRLFGLFLCLGVIFWLISAVVGLVLTVLPVMLLAVVGGLLSAMVACIFATAQAASYVELRRIVDGTDVNELAEIFA